MYARRCVPQSGGMYRSDDGAEWQRVSTDPRPLVAERFAEVKLIRKRGHFQWQHRAWRNLCRRNWVGFAEPVRR